MKPETNNSPEQIARRYFESAGVVDHYFRACHRVGLWKSEEKLLLETFSANQRLLDLGCGAGRIAFGLEKSGYTQVAGADYSSSMIEAARTIAEAIWSPIPFVRADARNLPWESESFDGVIFGFNGFFMIPGASGREKALGEIFRVLKPRGHYIFTGHDRSLPNQKAHWDREAMKRGTRSGDEGKPEFGDVFADAGLGTMYIHSADPAEVTRLLARAGFEDVQTWSRRELANESSAVREFADECRFWKAVKPAR